MIMFFRGIKSHKVEKLTQIWALWESCSLLFPMFNTVKVGDVLPSLTTHYLVLKTTDEDVYWNKWGRQARGTSFFYSLKRMKKSNLLESADLLFLFKLSLKLISPLNHKNLVKFFERFKYKRQECLVFEMLYRNLRYFMSHKRIPLS